VQQLFLRLNRLYTNDGNCRDTLESIKGRRSTDPKRNVEGLSIFKSGHKTTGELRRLAVDVVIIDVSRQEPGVGSCFAVSAFVKMQFDYTAKAMELCADMLCK
jgi:hypothetical protein